MRTLKKTLSLLLAVALVLSLTVVGASAAYTGNKVDTLKDAADVGADYSEAVGVMVGLGIIEGYDDGTLRPETTYTREQAAKIIAYMQLGPKDADSLRCTKAPFTDVAADRWSAGYIAYCVEQGIIDGMGDGTFQPEAQLTGYQWAKMLLCAVGYGRNDEYVGSSWSLNTAKDALDKGIFEGDLVGADHTPLQRQQAILYAFNTLTSVGVVVYSPSLGDYILAYGKDIIDRVTIEGTLGEKVYKLDVDTGIIVDNEAMGAAKTVLSVQGEYAADATAKGDDADVSVAANTGLDMMYHAAKIWHVNGKTAVYVMDLAKVEALTCNGITKSAVAKLEKGKTVTDKTIGDTTKTKYEYYFIDNTAINANYAGVTVWASLEALGTRSEVKKTTVIGNYKAVSNDYIKTDISEINKRDNVVVIKAGEKAYHVYAVGATSGGVETITHNGVITLTDGTVIAPSVLCDSVSAIVNDVKAALADHGHTAPVYAFVLDTHGHYISVTNNPYRTVAYYTGAVKLSSAHDAWSSDVTWLAQFVDVATGEVEEIPVTNAWARHYGIYGAFHGEGLYFDITDELYGDETYTPAVVQENELYGTSYLLTNAGETTSFKADSSLVECAFTDSETGAVYQDGKIRYNNASVNFIIASFQGDRLVIDEYTGVAELLAAYSEKYNDGIHTVTLENIAMVVERSDAGNFYATTIFAYDGALNVKGGILFFPTGVTASQWTAHTGYYSYPYAYLNGEASKDTIKVKPAFATNYDRGFYSYTVDDETGFYTLTKVKTDYIFAQSEIEGAGDAYWIGNKPVSADVKVVDLRAGVANGEVDAVEDLGDLLSHDFTDAWEKDLRVAYYVSGGQVVLVYVVDNKYGSVTVTSEYGVGDVIGPVVTEDGVIDLVKLYKDTPVAVFKYTGTPALKDGGELTVRYKLSKDSGTTWTDGTAVADIRVDKATKTTYLDVDFSAVIPDNAAEYQVKVTQFVVTVKVTNDTDIEGSSMRAASGYDALTAGEDDTYTVDLAISEAAGGYKVVLDNAAGVKMGTVVTVEGFDAEVPVDGSIRITLFDANEPVANLNAVINPVTLDTKITVDHKDDKDYWCFDDHKDTYTYTATLGKPEVINLYRTQGDTDFHIGDKVKVDVFGVEVTSDTALASVAGDGEFPWVCTISVNANDNDFTVTTFTQVCPGHGA